MADELTEKSPGTCKALVFSMVTVTTGAQALKTGWGEVDGTLIGVPVLLKILLSEFAKLLLCI